MKTYSSILYTKTKDQKYKKEQTYQNYENYFLKISLTADSKILFRCYDVTKLDCTCYQVIKSTEEIFNLYEELKMYETGSVLFNVLITKFNINYTLTYNKYSDTIIIETIYNDFDSQKKLQFELRKESITCLKEYIFILCNTIKKLKEDSSSLKNDTSTLKEDKVSLKDDIKKLNDEIENLKNQIIDINISLSSKQSEIDELK